MRKWLRRIRGAVGMGLTWAAGWAPLGAILGLFNFASGAAAFGSGPAWLAATSALFAAAGFVCGVTFSTALGITEGRRRFDQMSIPRFAGLGAVGGLLVGGLLVTLSVSLGGTPGLVDLFVNMGIVGLLGAGSSAGSLALARRAEGRELLETGEDLADAGLTEGEPQVLLRE
jgi:hypothetical protein